MKKMIRQFKSSILMQLTGIIGLVIIVLMTSIMITQNYINKMERSSAESLCSSLLKQSYDALGLYQEELRDSPGRLSYGYYSGEGVTHLNEGRPLFARTPDSNFTLANFMRSHLYASLGAVKLGLDILFKQEGVKVDKILGHGGLFKTPVVGQTYLAAAVNAPVTVMSTASEGGPWGMALLALYMLEKKEAGTDSFPALETWLEDKIFCRFEGTTIEPDAADVAGFETFTDHYSAGLDAERAAVECMRW